MSAESVQGVEMGPSRRRVILSTLALAGAAAVGGATFGYRRAMRKARASVAAARSRMVQTRHGPVEYAEAGSGATFLMLHGTGGGFDQGLRSAAALTALGHRVIAPSRFGYLRTPLPPEAGARKEAEAMVDLIDALGLDRIAVAGGSAGAIPALAFAGYFPERCAALFPIVPALAIPGRPAVAPWHPLIERAVFAALRSDLLFWAGITLAPDRIIGTVLATDPALVHASSAAERRRVGEMMEGLLPISARADGLLYDNAQTNRRLDLPLDRIVAPTLIVSAEDDRFRTAENARWLATRIAGSETLIFPDGGHLWVGHDTEMFAAIEDVLRRGARA